MKLTLAEPRYLKDSIAILSELVNEGRFTITKSAVELIAMDPANVAMVNFKLLSSAFTEYDLKEDTTLSINLANLKQILRRAGPNDMVTLELAPDNTFQITLKGKSTRTFSIPTLDLEEKEQKIPDLKFAATITTLSSTFTDAIEDADIVAESLSFLAEKDKLLINAEGDLSKASIEIPADDNTKIKADGNIKAKYSIEYLKKMITGSKISDEVSIQFNTDYPLKLEYKAIDKMLLQFILAPRVEND